MALVFRLCSRCFFYCFLLCGLSVNGEAPYNKAESRGSIIYRQQPEKQPEHHDDAQSQQQPPEMPTKSDSSTSSSDSRSVSPPSFVLVSETKQKETPDTVRSSLPEVTVDNLGKRETNVDEKNMDVERIDPDGTINNKKGQFATELDDKSSSIPLGNIDKRSDGINRGNRPTVDGNVASLGNKLNREGIEAIFANQEEYLQRYYGVNRRVKKEQKLGNKEKKRDDVLSSLSSNQKPASATLLNKPRDGRSVTERNGHVGGTDDEIIESKRRSKLYEFDKRDTGVHAFNFTEEGDDYATNYDEQFSKYTGGRVKRRAGRVRDEWAYEEGRRMDYGGLDYRDTNKERHDGVGSRSRRERKGRGPKEIKHSDDPDRHIPRSSRRSHQRSISNGKDGGGGRRIKESGGAGGGGRGGAGRDRHHRNRRIEVDSSERGSDSERDEGFGSEERTHRGSSSSSSPSPLSSQLPSDHADPYGRYSQHSSRNRNSKSPIQKTCHICTMKKMDREVRLRTLKAQIIKQIGLNELPNITESKRILSRVPTLKHIIENMTMQRDEPSWSDTPDDDKVDDINEQMIITAEKPSHLGSYFGSNLNGLSYFNVSGKLETSIVKEASLWLYLRSHSKIRRSTVEVRIWNAFDQLAHFEPLKILKIDIGRFGEWTHFKATSTIKQWVKNPKLNYGLNITAVDSYGNSRIWTPDTSNHAEEYPVMDIKFSPRRHSRHRRTVGETCTEEEHTGRCCLYPLVVDFLEMKWNWMIYPHNFVANYCSGNCSLETIDDNLPSSYVGFKSTTTIDSVRCCTSTREGRLQILYHTQANKIIHTYLEDIIVEECGCR